MTAVHAPINWFSGDDWEIRATLIDENDEPFDLSGAPVIQWALVNSARQQVLNETDADISIVDAPAGKCSIVVPAAKTSPLPTGHYNDAIRIVINGVTSTLSTGPIYVTADPWIAAQQQARLRKVS